MGKYIAAIVTVVITGAIILGILGVLNYFGYGMKHTVSATAVGSSTTSSGTVNHVSLTVETFPADPNTDPQGLSTFKSLEAKSESGGSGSPGPGRSEQSIQFPGPGAHPSWVTYWPTTKFVVPAHSLVTMTILNWDSQTPLLNDYYARPYGTVNAQGVVNNSEQVTTYDAKGNPVTTTYDWNHPADPATVSHTFTLRPIPGGNTPFLFVSVPDIGVSGNAPTDANGFPTHPVANTFTFMTQGPGLYHWNCFDPCGSRFDGFGGPMQTFGYMSGTLQVK